MSTSVIPPPQCEAIAELLPWHANGTLGALDRATVDSHIAECGSCRTTLAVEKRIVEAIRAPRDNVEQSPHAGWQRLAAQLDGVAPREAVSNRASPSGAQARRHASSARTSAAAESDSSERRRRINWAAALGAAVAVQAAAIAVLAVALVRHRQAEERAPRFVTVTSADPTLAASGPLVRIAFDGSVNESTAHGLAKEVSGVVLAGPSPKNVYTFEFRPAPDATGVEDKVSWLRRQSHVLLVEPVVLSEPAATDPQPAAKP